MKRAKELERISKLSAKNKRFIDRSIIPFKVETKYSNTSILAQNAILSLNYEEKLIAGLPWFFQRWSRDELISLPGLLYLSKPQEYKKILMFYITKLDNGALKIFENYGSSFDGVGWLCKRIYDYYKIIKNLGGTPFTEHEIKEIVQNLSEFIVRMNSMEDFMFSKYNDSWMDTQYGPHKREGYVLEHQVMVLLLYDLVHELTKERDLTTKRKEKVEALKKAFFSGDKYFDTLNDDAIRPNIFLAWYLYPNLFSHKEWEPYFDYAIQHLWLDWGGFSTINRDHPSFVDHYTGQNNQSYHRGDSWFWINNIAAIALHKVNSKKYSKYVNKILEASTFELEKLGFIGYCAEISSNNSLKAEGCLNQLWSSSTYLELLDRVILGN